jgi:hypothetical protein
VGIRFRCHHCEHELHVKDFQAGKRGRCPACQGRFRIPLSDADYSLDPASQVAVLPDAASTANSTQAVSSKNASPSAPDGNQPTSSADESSQSHPSSVSLPPKPSPATADQSSAPGEPAAVPQTDMAHWYVRPPAGGQYGPASTELLNQWVSERRVTADSLVWRDGWEDWQLAANALPQFHQSDAQHQSSSPRVPPPAEPTTGHAKTVSHQRSAEMLASNSPAFQVGLSTDEASTRNPSPATAAPISGAFSQPPTPTDANPSRPSLGERNRLERRRRKRRNYLIMLSVLTVLAIGLITALIVALVVQN